MKCPPYYLKQVTITGFGIGINNSPYLVQVLVKDKIERDMFDDEKTKNTLNDSVNAGTDGKLECRKSYYEERNHF